MVSLGMIIWIYHVMKYGEKGIIQDKEKIFKYA